MKKFISILTIALVFTITVNAQESMAKKAMMKDNTTVVNLEQTKRKLAKNSNSQRRKLYF